jgi:hypothetical protein
VRPGNARCTMHNAQLNADPIREDSHDAWRRIAIARRV